MLSMKNEYTKYLDLMNAIGNSNTTSDKVKNKLLDLVTKVDMSLPIINNTLVDCAKNFGHAYAIRIDGAPKLELDESLDIEERFKKASKERLNIDANNKSSAFLDEMNDINAVTAEVDYLEALRCASDSINQGTEDFADKTIICCGSGISTTGYLNCNNNVLNSLTVLKILLLNLV